MGLDRAPIDFQTFYFSHVLLDPPTTYSVCKIRKGVCLHVSLFRTRHALRLHAAKFHC